MKDWADKAGHRGDELFPKPADDGDVVYPLAAIRESKRGAFQYGAVWMRNQLRTDEAVERLADALFADFEGCTIAQHEAECPRAECPYRVEYTRSARAVITVLLGEES